MATLGQQVAERRKQREIRDRKNYGQYGSGFKATRDRLAAEKKFLNRLGGFRIFRGPDGNEFRYPGQDNQDLRYDAEYNIETSSPFNVFPQALSRGLPSAGYQKYMGMMGDPEEKEKQDLILQGLEMQPEFSAYPLTTSDVGDIAFRTGDTGMYNTDDIESYYGQPTEGTMRRANPFVQELTETGDIPLYDIRRPVDIKMGYRDAFPRDERTMTKQLPSDRQPGISDINDPLQYLYPGRQPGISDINDPLQYLPSDRQPGISDINDPLQYLPSDRQPGISDINDPLQYLSSDRQPGIDEFNDKLRMGLTYPEGIGLDRAPEEILAAPEVDKPSIWDKISPYLPMFPGIPIPRGTKDLAQNFGDYVSGGPFDIYQDPIMNMSSYNRGGIASLRR